MDIEKIDPSTLNTEQRKRLKQAKEFIEKKKHKLLGNHKKNIAMREYLKNNLAKPLLGGDKK
jgi:hypothetical protein